MVNGSMSPEREREGDVHWCTTLRSTVFCKLMTTRPPWQHFLVSWRLFPLYIVLLIALGPMMGGRLRQVVFVVVRRRVEGKDVYQENTKVTPLNSTHSVVVHINNNNNEGSRRNHSKQERTGAANGLGTVTAKLIDDQVRQVLDLVPPRAFPFSMLFRQNTNEAATELPCFPPHPQWRTRRAISQTTGLLFCKPTKVGGSTAAGVHLRIARNAADRQNKNFSICHNSWDHGRAKRRFAHRDKTQSLLWTVLRDPTRRLVSMFYHFLVSRGHCNATAANFRRYIIEQKYAMNDSYYLKTVSMHPTTNPDNQMASMESILYDYDFVAVTERMDESMVVLSILWGIPLADVLYLSAKKRGSYDGGGGGCHWIPKREIAPDLQEILDSEAFQSIIRWDRVAHQLANRSLDKTIDETIGRDRFNQEYAKYRNAMQLVHEKCAAEVVTPCTGGGLFANSSSSSSQQQFSHLLLRPGKKKMQRILDKGLGLPRQYRDTDCLAVDSGCGYMCLDDVATELNLWYPAVPMQYRFPHAFGLGPSSLQRLAAAKELIVGHHNQSI